jgi:ABC-2 type transport system ATP-binding protein
MSDIAAVETCELTKVFGAARAVDRLNLRVPAGTVYGFLGPNGAGKTTTIRMLATLLRPDAGTARVFGHDVVADAAAVRARVSLTGQFASLDEELTGAENLRLLARLRGFTRAAARRRAGELLDCFGLAQAADRQVRKPSGGMCRRLDIAASLLVSPDLLFLDEPTTGLDPHSRTRVWATVRTLVAAGGTVLLTTQYLDEADQLADHVAVIDHGTIIAEGTPGQLKAATGAGHLQVRLANPDRRAEADRMLHRVLGAATTLDADPVAISVRVPAGQAERVAAALAALARAGIPVVEFALGQPSLEEVFLTLTTEKVPA